MRLRIILLQLLVPCIEAGRLQDLRGDPCDRAAIPWSPFTTHARLDSSALSRVISRTQGSHYLRTRESIVLHNGEEDVILTQVKNDVALVIKGDGIGSKVQHECVVSTTHVYLPKSSHHLVVDAQASNVFVDSVQSTFGTLELLLNAGDVQIAGSVLQIDHFSADLKAGSIRIGGGLAAKFQRISSHAGQVTGHLIQGLETMLRANAGSIHVILDEPTDQAQVRNPRVIDVSTEAGGIALDSRLLEPARIRASAKYGAVTVSVLPGFDAKVHLEARMGHVKIPKSLTVTEDKRTWTSRAVDGFLGRSEQAAAGTTIRASSEAGSVILIVPEDGTKGGL
ncbi:protein of unknown function [Taphrina deformans PYCC 5710]|uniref:Uncharacterized protein n=1 Tax=Taphrina deformans (strain PYCC 5710 / ATCC 11124 / CBS 356.35 / IMI 108563 / JCM 9778 / NBRC 8474) TaxID=1097556 RepID=R4XAE1_TAPDE|nr:protein of unknown function [Taphrina deformans PYCC 5710]|eukprot:CCG82784.1 protein of unknown function [Taphrina deformans PYCC 5710]